MLCAYVKKYTGDSMVSHLICVSTALALAIVRCCLKSAAEKGSTVAKYNLGFCYENGYGVLHSSKKTIEWYEKAAASGHEGARKALARLKGGL